MFIGKNQIELSQEAMKKIVQDAINSKLAVGDDHLIVTNINASGNTSPKFTISIEPDPTRPLGTES